jgi:membrane-anchored protein YejM (alkaline phosphatase superfamily)
MRPYYLALDPDLGYHKRLCFGSQPRHKLMMDYTTQFVNHYAEMNKPSFIFSFHGELSHDSINLIGLADNDLRSWLEELSSIGVLNRTIFVLMSDHGNRFAEIRNTLQGKQEERLPFFR